MWLIYCLGCVASFEGVRTVAYLDPVGIPTVCFGETANVRLGDNYSIEECRKLLGTRVAEFGRAVDKCVNSELPPARKAALVSFSYNVGQTAFCNSTLVKLLNEGKTVEACNQLPRWVKAKGITLPGLVKRREQEREMCMEGLV
jgi:lysozyme